MATTPKKLVHWEMDGPSISALDSPFFDSTCESSVVSTSSLEFINSQLVAHGFVSSPGLSLEGISNDDSTRVVKCLLGLLSQRVVCLVETPCIFMIQTESRKICRAQRTSQPSSALCPMIMKECYPCIAQLTRKLPMPKEKQTFTNHASRMLNTFFSNKTP